MTKITRVSTSSAQRLFTLALMTGAVLLGAAGPGVGPTAPFATLVAGAQECPPAADPAQPADCTTSTTTPPDTAPPDTAPPDTAPPDTTPPDTTPPDTAPPDTAPPDTAPPDTTPPDTTPPPTEPPTTTTTAAPTTTTTAPPTTTTQPPATTTTTSRPTTTTAPPTTTTTTESTTTTAPNKQKKSGKNSTPSTTAPPDGAGPPPPSNGPIMTTPTYGIRPNAPAPSGPGTVGGLLVSPRPSQAPAEAAAPTAASPAAPASAAAPGNLSPRAGNGDEAAIDPADPSSSENVVLGLPREMSLAELFPAEAAMGAAPPDVILKDGEIAAGRVGGVGSDPEDSTSQLPLVAGLLVTLTILLSGGGYLWWRNLDSEYWETA